MTRRSVLAVIGFGTLAWTLSGCGGDDGSDVESLIDEVEDVESCDELFELNEDMEFGRNFDAADFTSEEQDRITGAFEEKARRLLC